MYVTKHKAGPGTAWAVDGKLLSPDFSFTALMQLPRKEIQAYLTSAGANSAAGSTETSQHQLLAPVENYQEIWAAGVTYRRSRDAREAETEVKDIYEKVYQAERPELFFKAIGWRVRGHLEPIRVRKDSKWNVPEPELTLLINSRGEIVGYCAGNDVSSRDIEGENPLYLPQAKMYDGSCAIGPGIRLVDPEKIRDLPIQIEIIREGIPAFKGSTATGQMNRSLEELASCLFREMTYPDGVFLMTGTGIVPPENFSMQPGDIVRIDIDSLVLENTVYP